MVRIRRLAVGVFGGLALCGIASDPALAHVGSIESATTQPPIPTWFVVLTAGVVVGSSFLFTSLMADHATLRIVNGLGRDTRLPTALVGAVRVGLRIVSVALLVGLVIVGFVGPSDPQTNAATLGLWVGWWGGYTMTTYLVGNSWPALDPLRELASLVPTREPIDYPPELGAWPAVVGLLALVWFEVATGASGNPRLLAGLVLGYVAVSLVGTAVVGRYRWFDRVDPIASVFRTYGGLAPIQRTADGLSFRIPGGALTDGDVPTTPGRPAFVVALLWGTTFDGLVSTPSFQAVAGPLLGVGVPPQLLYLVVLAAGFGIFYGVYRLACRRSRETADSFVSADAIARWFAPSLVPIAAGYHLAHFLGYVVSLAPALVETMTAPLTIHAAVTIVPLPEWFGLVQLSFVVLGHLMAIWVAHSIAFELFPGARQPIRSQYPMILVMIGYTMVSAWVIVAPATEVLV